MHKLIRLLLYFVHVRIALSAVLLLCRFVSLAFWNSARSCIVCNAAWSTCWTLALPVCFSLASQSSFEVTPLRDVLRSMGGADICAQRMANHLSCDWLKERASRGPYSVFCLVEGQVLAGMSWKARLIAVQLSQ